VLRPIEYSIIANLSPTYGMNEWYERARTVEKKPFAVVEAPSRASCARELGHGSRFGDCPALFVFAARQRRCSRLGQSHAGLVVFDSQRVAA